jgi:hypothetical protein
VPWRGTPKRPPKAVPCAIYAVPCPSGPFGELLVEQLTGEQFRATGRVGPLAVTGGDALMLHQLPGVASPV